jgi:hypothetical protein
MQWFVDSETVDTGTDEILEAHFVHCSCGYDSSFERLPFEDHDDAWAFGKAHALTHQAVAA